MHKQNMALGFEHKVNIGLRKTTK